MASTSSNHKVAVVTGSSGGIGYETSSNLGKKWLSYICHDEETKKK